MTDEVTQGRDPSRPPIGGRHQRTLVMAGVVLVFLAVVAVVGIVRGKPDATPKASNSPTTAATTGSGGVTGPPLALTGARCATLVGDKLTVGFGVTNRGTSTLIVSELTPSFPLGGLTPDASAPPSAATCTTPPSDVPAIIGPGDDTLLAFVLTASDPLCVAPLPVDVGIDYQVDGGGSYGETLHAFPDLGSFGLPSDCSSPSG